MNLRAIDLFVTVAAARSLSDAARSLRVPLSTLSRQLRELESELRVPLLERTTRRMELTEAGRNFLAEVRDPIAALRAADTRVRERSSAGGGRLRIAAAPTLAVGLLPEPLTRYLREQPHVAVEVWIGAEPLDLRASGVDLAIRVGPVGEVVLPSRQNLVVRRLQKTRSRMVASPAYLRRRGTPKRRADLADHDLVSLLSASRTWQFEPGEPPLAVAPRVLAGSASCARELCLQGAGIAVLPEFLVASDLERGSLVELNTFTRPASKQIFVVFPRERGSLPAVRAFLDILYAALSS